MPYRKKRLGNTRTTRSSKATRAAGGSKKKYSKKKRYSKKRNYKRKGGKTSMKNLIQRMQNDAIVWRKHIGVQVFDTNGAYPVATRANGEPATQGVFGYFGMECFTGALGTGMYSPYGTLQTVVSPVKTATTSSWLSQIVTDYGGSVTLTSKVKLQIEYAKLKGVITNPTNIPLTVKVYKCAWRNDEGSEGELQIGQVYNYSLTNDGLTTKQTNITPYDSPTFTGMIRIIKARTYTLGAGMSINLKMKAPLNKYEYYNMQSIAQQPIMKRFTRAYLIVHYGQLAVDNQIANVGAVTTAPSRLLCKWEASMKTRIINIAAQNNTVDQGVPITTITAANLETGLGNANAPGVVDTV